MPGTEILLMAMLLVLLSASAAAIFFLRRLTSSQRGDAGQLARLADTAAGLAGAQAALEGRLAQMSEQTAAERAQLTKSLQERLDGVGKQLGESLEKSATRTAASLGELGKHLDVIDKAQHNIADLASQVIGLQDILDNKQARGVFGEVQLENLVSSILPPSAYSFQATMGNGRRVDCLIQLPNPPGPIAVDSKFPLESYYALRAAKDDGELKRAQTDFRAAIRKHVNDIRERYVIPGETSDSALMFLPSEAVYAELHGNFPDAVEQSYRARVWIVSPTTLMATLNTVRAVLKDARMREQAGVIQIEVQKLLDDVDRLDKRVDNLGKHFDQASRDIKEITTSSDKIHRRAEKIEEVQLEDSDADAVQETPSVRIVGSSVER